MKIFNKFKGNKDTEQSNLVENGDYTKPEALSQSVKNEKIEPGMPLNLNTAAPNNMRSNCIFHPVGQKYKNSNQDVWIPFSAK